MNPSDLCWWTTGNYTNDCICEFCKHKFECSGFDNFNDEDEDFNDKDEE